jgi:hypothetical protein
MAPPQLPTTMQKLQTIANFVETMGTPDRAGGLKLMIEDALKMPTLPGDPGELGRRGQFMRETGAVITDIRKQLNQATGQCIPEAWSGGASERALDVTLALEDDLITATNVCNFLSSIFTALADVLADAAGAYDGGLPPLHAALRLLDTDATVTESTMARAQADALSGLNIMIAACRRAQAGAVAAQRDLDECTQRARAELLTTPSLSASEKLALADSSFDNTKHFLNLILKPDTLRRASAQMDQLSPQDKEAFTKLLDNAKSEPERAYLLKALAAGHNLDEVTKFDATIHKFGDKPDQLRSYLEPIDARDDHEQDPGRETPTKTRGVQWTQEQKPTCVAMSTVLARAEVDPVYALGVTSGGHPGDPQYDNPQALQQRLLNEQHRIDGDRTHPVNPDYDIRSSPDASDQSLSDEVGTPLGRTYESVAADDIDSRRAVLPSIERSVDDGKPVTVSVYDRANEKTDGHQMVVLARQDGKLQIYNPWGYTEWVSEDDFVNGRIPSATRGVTPDIRSVQVPK